MTQLKLEAIRRLIYQIIFGTDTPAGKMFDVILLYSIIISVLAVMLESVKPLNERFHLFFQVLEWGVTFLFSLEFIARVFVVKKPIRYILSFYGVIDILSILPAYLSFFFPGAQSLLVIRVLRLLRIFRIFKMMRFLNEAQYILNALRAGARKILVFLLGVLTLVTVVGTMMYLVEGETSGFENIPVSIYWSIVTVTTVGFGDITPTTTIGQMLASALMLTGYAIIAVPTGLVTAEIMRYRRGGVLSKRCDTCTTMEDDPEANYCRKCGTRLSAPGHSKPEQT